MDRLTDGGSAVDAIRAAAVSLGDGMDGWDRLLDAIGDARLVLLGEASHGTNDFYRVRAALTRRLIADRGFTAVVVEADWPDAYRVNLYARGFGDDESAEQALAGFRRFPQWMWRNTVVVELVEWLRAWNVGQPDERRKAGFYGMDLYSLTASIEAVIGYLNATDPEAARRAIERYSCFEMFAGDPENYGYATGFGAAESCEDAVVAQLQEMQRHATWLDQASPIAEDAAFAAEQNARLVRNAEEYYRSLFRGHASSWNLRDRHMVETLDALLSHLDRYGDRTKAVLWAHNSHLGDARATAMGRGGEWNVGQLVREQYGADAVLVGFTTHTGTVTAADNWGEPARVMRVNPSLPGSWERLMHDTGLPRFWVNLRDDDRLRRALGGELLERAIGVIYRPGAERASHYFLADMPAQFDLLIHLDETRALEPLERWAEPAPGELPDTYPFTG